MRPKFSKPFMLAATLLTGLVMSHTALAAGGGSIFVGGGIAYSDGEDTFADMNARFAVDGDDFAYRILLGVDINDWLRVHGGWTDLGQFDAGVLQLSSGAMSSGEAEVDGFFGGATAFYHLGHDHKYWIQGTLGIMAWDAEFNGAVQPAEDDGSELYYGIGIGGKINTQWSWSADYIRYEVDQIQVDTIGVTVRFYPAFANPFQ